MLLNAVLAAILSLGMGATGFATTVQLQWDPNTEADLAGYKVYYADDSSPLAASVPLDVHNQTSATISGLNPDNSYQFAVTAYNTAGQESSFSNVVHVSEMSPPAVAIVSPGNSVSVSGTVSISVNASDNVGVVKVEYYVNGELKYADTSYPYLFSWDTSTLAPGAYTLMAKAYDAAGNVSQSATSTVTVVNDVTPPNVALTAPANNAAVSGTVTISSTSSDNVGVSRVEYYSNGSLLFAGNVSPFSFSWDTREVANGSYTITAKAYDNAGNSKQSSLVTVRVSNPVTSGSEPTIADASLALQIAVGKVIPTNEQKARLDVAPVIDGTSTPDGKVNTGDAIVILSKIVGKVN
jgi:hypothetical protein